MILSESRRRTRSNALHAETEAEFIQKLDKQDKDRQILVEPQQISPQLDGFIENQNFSFEPIDTEPIFLIQETAIYKSHYILLMNDDFSMNTKKMQQIMDSSETADNLTDSTSEDQIQATQFILKQEVYVHSITISNQIHKFYIWILNHDQPIDLFKQLYYPLFEAFFIVTEKGPSKQNLFEEQFQQLRFFNKAILKFIISDSDDMTNDKQNNMLNILKQLI